MNTPVFDFIGKTIAAICAVTGICGVLYVVLTYFNVI